jgi:hypothetical protein
MTGRQGLAGSVVLLSVGVAAAGLAVMGAVMGLAWLMIR